MRRTEAALAAQRRLAWLLFLEGRSVAAVYHQLAQQFGNQAASLRTVQRWHADVQRLHDPSQLWDWLAAPPDQAQAVLAALAAHWQRCLAWCPLSGEPIPPFPPAIDQATADAIAHLAQVFPACPPYLLPTLARLSLVPAGPFGEPGSTLVARFLMLAAWDPANVEQYLVVSAVSGATMALVVMDPPAPTPLGLVPLPSGIAGRGVPPGTVVGDETARAALSAALAAASPSDFQRGPQGR